MISSRTVEPSTHILFFFFFQAEDGIRDYKVTGVQTCALPIYSVVLPGQSVALNPGVPGATLLAPPFQGNFLDRNVWFNTVGLYFQDDYRATSRLTLNLGLRYEFRTQFTEQYGRFANVPDIHTSTN